MANPHLHSLSIHRKSSNAECRSDVIEEASFSLEKGQSYAILGQSGSGKSVLLKMLAGLIRPDGGEISLGTQNVGMLFQKNALFDSLTVFENLDFTLKEGLNLSTKERKRLCDQYLSWVELRGTERLYPDELSGGMQKRLGIARALILGPELVFYEEPTAGLDPITSEVIASLIARLNQETRSTIVTVTSDVLRAFQVASVIGILLPGKRGQCLHTIGSPAEVKNSQNPAVMQFISGSTQGPLTPPTQEDHS
jgi:phospholipid/cholesterol/gamma-HCH transport system ATP-binding protein